MRKQAAGLVILKFSAALTSRQQEFPINWTFPKVGLINLSCLRPSLFQFGVEMKRFERLLSAVYSNLLRLFIETNISEKRPRLEYISIQELRQKSGKEKYKSYHFLHIYEWWCTRNLQSLLITTIDGINATHTGHYNLTHENWMQLKIINNN